MKQLILEKRMQPTITKRIEESKYISRKGDPLVNVQQIKIHFIYTNQNVPKKMRLIK